MTQPWIEGRFEEGFIITTVEQGINWARQSSIWPMTFGLACCAIEMMAAGASRYDIDRFGAGAFRASPRQADLMIVAGTVTYKMASRVRRLYNLMPDPKFVIAMGACTVGGGPYFKYGYHVVKGVDLVVPVDVYVPGCPPRPEALLEGLMRIQDKIRAIALPRPRAPTPAWPVGAKIEDELPVPHHSGYVDASPTKSRCTITKRSPVKRIANATRERSSKRFADERLRGVGVCRSVDPSPRPSLENGEREKHAPESINTNSQSRVMSETLKITDLHVPPPKASKSCAA